LRICLNAISKPRQWMPGCNHHAHPCFHLKTCMSTSDTLVATSLTKPGLQVGTRIAVGTRPFPTPASQLTVHSAGGGCNTLQEPRHCNMNMTERQRIGIAQVKSSWLVLMMHTFRPGTASLHPEPHRGCEIHDAVRPALASTETRSCLAESKCARLDHSCVFGGVCRFHRSNVLIGHSIRA
jgi:hypothetical protein